MRESGRRSAIGLGLLGGGAHAISLLLAFGVPALWWLTMLSLTPLVVVASRAGSRPKHVALGAAIGSLAFWGWTHRWIAEVSLLGLPVLLVHLVMYPGVYVWLIARLARRSALGVVLLGGALWAGLEVLRGEVLWGGYAWFAVGQPVIEWPWAARPASIGGAYLITLLVAVISAALGGAMLARARRAALALTLVVGAAWIGLSAVSAPPVGDEIFRVAAVQTNLPQRVKQGWQIPKRIEDFARFEALTLEANGEDPDLIVWPETMFPGDALDPESLDAQRESGLSYTYQTPDGPTGLALAAFADRLFEIQRSIRIPMIVGAKTFEGLAYELTPEGADVDWDRLYNSAVLVRRGEALPGAYAKMHLTPFGEVMPGISRIEWLERAMLSLGAGGMTFDLDRSTEARVLVLDANDGSSLAIGTPICFESSSAWVCRRLVVGGEHGEGGGRRARILINLTNDGWFGGADDGRRWHVMMGRWRCVELGTPMVRSANTGISCAIDAAGRVTAGPKTTGPAPRQDGVLVADVRLADADRLTLYARGGWWATWIVLALGAGACAWAIIGAPRTSSNTPASADEVDGDRSVGNESNDGVGPTEHETT